MKDYNKNISSRISDFEPEVDDASIDKGWEKIKYFLPEKKKRRGFMFFRKQGLALFLGMTAMLSLGVLLFKPLTDTENNASGAPKNNLTENKKTLSGERSHAFGVLTNEESPKEARPEQAAKVQGSGVKESHKKTADKRNYDKPAQLSATLRSAKKENELPAAQNEPATELKPFQNKDASALSFPGETDPVTYQKLDLMPLGNLRRQEKSDSLEPPFVFIDRNMFLAESGSGKFGLEFFTGPARAVTTISGADNNLNGTHRKINLSLGLGINYFYNSRWSINSQFRVSRNVWDYHEESTSNNITDKKKVPVVNSMSPDSLIRYVEVHSSKTIRSKVSYNLNAGFEYTFFRKSGLKMGALLQASLYSTRYKLVSSTTESTDTVTYLFNSTTKPPVYSAGTVPPSYKTSYVLTSLGLVPGLVFSYTINSKITVIFRPSYFSQLTGNKTNSRQKYFDTKQAVLFMDLGLRIKL